MRNATNLRTVCSLEFIFAFLDIFINQHVTSMLLFSSIYIELSPKLPWGIQRICRPFVLKTYYHYESLCLSRDSLSCDTRSLDLLYASDTFRPILALFTHFALHQFFHMYITTRNIFLIPDNAVDWGKLGI